MRWILYNVVLFLAMVLTLPHYYLKMKRRGGYRKNFGDRFGRYSAETREKIGDGGAILIHAVSVGEVGVADQFIRAMREVNPGQRFVLSTTSSTGWKEAVKRLPPEDVVIYNPLDLPGFVKRALDVIRPSAFILVETEIWPNLIRECKRRAIPMCLINGRLSDRTAPTYRRLRFIFGPALRCINMLQVQSALDEERYVAAGADPASVLVTGSFKFDVARRNPEKEKMAASLLRALDFSDGRRILMGASTWAGEEKLLAESYLALRAKYPDLRLMLVPRHMERAADVCGELRTLGLNPVRKSDLDAGREATAPLGADDVLVVDTTGEIMGFFPYAAVCVVGRTFCSGGGQNMIEPCLCGVPTVVGPLTQNFRPVMADLLASKAIVQVPSAQSLQPELDRLLGDAEVCAALGARAEKAVLSRRGAVNRCVTAVRDAIGLQP